MGFLRHFTPELLSIKKSATFAHSTFRIIIPSVGFIPSLVAPQQSQCPFIPTNKSTENFYDTVRFTLPLQQTQWQLPAFTKPSAGDSICATGRTAASSGYRNSASGHHKVNFT